MGATATLEPTIPDDELDGIFAALANSTRRAMLARLAQGEATVNELAEPFDISLPAISKHIKVLEEVGLIRQGRQAQYRPCRLQPDSLAAVAGWTEQYRHIWETSFDRMDTYLSELTGTDHRPEKNRKPGRTARPENHGGNK
ncbi:MAG: metalloregulator ArsR/SmtB family transcription factor [Acidimicrobiia bacterium]|nr:metalloregulator ArsR/SmtB family transcription factor [Acidimicrobiia bacterium]